MKRFLLGVLMCFFSFENLGTQTTQEFFGKNDIMEAVLNLNPKVSRQVEFLGEVRNISTQDIPLGEEGVSLLSVNYERFIGTIYYDKTVLKHNESVKIKCVFKDFFGPEEIIKFVKKIDNIKITAESYKATNGLLPDNNLKNVSFVIWICEEKNDIIEIKMSCRNK